METVDAFENHLEKLSYKDWEKLFELIPQIESCEKFITGGGIVEDEDDPDSFIITPIIVTKIVLDFERIMDELELVIPFNWPSWDIGREIVKTGVYNNLDSITLLKLLTAFIRNNRFCDGALAARFEDKSIEKILIELKKNIDLAQSKTK